MTPQAVNGSPDINFLGSLDFYSGSQFVPDGKYIITKLDVVMYSGKQGNMKPRLGVMVHFLPLDKPTPDNEVTQFYSMGSKADALFAPNATGKGLAKIPGAAGTSLQENTNWMILLKSLFDCGLPQGMFSNDLTPVEGVHVVVTNVKEPDERKAYKQSGATANAIAGVAGGATPGQQDVERVNLIPIVTEILEGGAPWEGGGGVPAVAASKPKAAVKAAAKAAPAPAAPADPGNTDMLDLTSSEVANVIMKTPNGTTFPKLKVGVFTSVKKAQGEVVAAEVVKVLENAEQLASILGELGYVLDGNNVKAV